MCVDIKRKRRDDVLVSPVVSDPCVVMSRNAMMNRSSRGRGKKAVNLGDPVCGG